MHSTRLLNLKSTYNVFWWGEICLQENYRDTFKDSNFLADCITQRCTVNNSRCYQWTVMATHRRYKTTLTMVTSVRTLSGFPSHIMSLLQEASIWPDASSTNSTGVIQLVSVRILFPQVPGGERKLRWDTFWTVTVKLCVYREIWLPDANRFLYKVPAKAPQVTSNTFLLRSWLTLGCCSFCSSISPSSSAMDTWWEYD